MIKKAHNVSLPASFFGALDPTGVTTFNQAMESESGHKQRRIASDIGGFAGGAILGATVPGVALMGAGAMMRKGKFKELGKELITSGKGSFDVLNPFRMKKHFQAIPDLIKLKNTGGELFEASTGAMNNLSSVGKSLKETRSIPIKSKKIDEKVQSTVDKLNIRKPLEAMGMSNIDFGIKIPKNPIEVSRNIFGLKKGYRTLKQKSKELTDLDKEISQKYYGGKPVSEGSTRTMSAITTLLPVGISGGMSALSSHLQYSQALKEKEKRNNMNKYSSLSPLLNHSLLGAATGGLTDAVIGAFSTGSSKEFRELKNKSPEKANRLITHAIGVGGLAGAGVGAIEGSVHAFGSLRKLAGISKSLNVIHDSIFNKTASRVSMTAFSALGGIGLVGGAMGAKAKADFEADPRFSHIRKHRKAELEKAQMVSGFLDGALKGGVAAPVVMDFLIGRGRV